MDSGTTSKEVLTDVIVSPIADEPLISTMLAEELEIAVEFLEKVFGDFAKN